MIQYDCKPIQDTGEHIDGNMCKCSPKMIEESGNIIWVHNSFDGRESLEEAKEILGLKHETVNWEVYQKEIS